MIISPNPGCWRRYCALLACLGATTLSSFALTTDWVLVGWNDLGMHCMDGSDYSVFSVLPPYNTIYAHLIYRGKLVTNTAGITVSYEAVSDPAGSINRSTKDKINFWEYVGPLYGATPAPDVGLAGFAMPGVSNQAQAMHAAGSHFIAEGIPISVFDDSTNKNYYPMMRLVARQAGTNIATTAIVLPVSDEMDCRACHGSGADAAAQPAGGWAWNCQQEKDVKLNILRLHDEKNGGTTLYTNLLTMAGYQTNGLLATVAGGTPVLCARCHKSNALPGTGLPGAPDFTHAMHTLHATVVDPTTGLTLDAAGNRTACYRCHPGSATRCLRGAMGKAIATNGTMAIQCQDCHGRISNVGLNTRQGWLQEPLCQSCHTGPATHSNGQIRYTSTFVISNQTRIAVDRLFASNTNAPAAGLSLYRFSMGHGNLMCEACHGSTHAEFPSAKRNDNLQCIALQGHTGKLGDCLACHVTTPNTVSNGPHGMHPVGWLSGHKDPGETEAQCATCHGTDYRGTVLSRMFADRKLTYKWSTNAFWMGQQIGCYTCHNGPNDDNPNPNPRPVAHSTVAATTAGTPIQIGLQATDANPLTLRIVSQPEHGTAGLSGTNATYFPEATFVGHDTFTYAAWNGSADSNLATGSVDVVQGVCQLSLSAIAPDTAAVTAAVPFWASATISGCSNTVAYSWNFGDGSATTQQQNTCHAYYVEGVYQWAVTANAGVTNVTHTGEITVSYVPEAVSLWLGVCLLPALRRWLPGR